MPAKVRCEISLPDPLEPLVLGLHTIDAQTGTVNVVGSTMNVERNNVIVEDGYVVHITLHGSDGYDLEMDVFVDDEKQNNKAIKPNYKNGSSAYEFLYIER